MHPSMAVTEFLFAHEYAAARGHAGIGVHREADLAVA
jgi:hypothetical protein